MVDVDRLITALDDDDRSVRQRAAVELGGVRTNKSAEALVARLGRENDCFVSESLTWATVHVGEAAVPGVLRLLQAPDPAVRSQAAHVLSKIGRPDHADALLPLVSDADPQVAAKVFRAVANTGDPRAAAALASRLGDGDGEQRDALVSAMSTLGEPAIGVLIEALSDADFSVRAHAADALGHVGSPLADTATAALALLLADPDADVRISAVSALRELTTPEAASALERARQSADPVVAAIASSGPRR